MLSGLGFLVWKLYELLPFDATAKKLSDLGVRWISIKMLDGATLWNHTDEFGKRNGSPKLINDCISAFNKVGIEVGGWGFLYTDNITQYNQARAVGTLLDTFDIKHWLIDAEDFSVLGARWKTHPSRKELAKSYMQYLPTPPNFPVGLCTYRYPSYHREFPFAEFLNHPKVTFSAPQVYWMMAQNSGFQLRKSYAEYSGLTSKPFVPIGASFCEYGWCPTASSITEFINVVDELSLDGYGFWTLEEGLTHPDWIDAMQTVPTPPPVVEPPDCTDESYPIYRVNVANLNCRDHIIPSRYGAQAGTVYYPSKVWFAEPYNTEVVGIEVYVDGKNRWIRVGQRQWMAEIYDGNIFLVKK